MIKEKFNDFPFFGKLLGIDWGKVRCGIAVSDTSQKFVFAREQIDCKQKNLLYEILKIIKEDNIKAVVVGLPLRSDGSFSETANLVIDFAKKLEEKTDIDIFFIDETLTSITASENLSNSKKIKEKLDSESARIILENIISLSKRINK